MSTVAVYDVHECAIDEACQCTLKLISEAIPQAIFRLAIVGQPDTSPRHRKSYNSFLETCTVHSSRCATNNRYQYFATRHLDL